MEFKVVISDPATGKSYQQELKDEKAKKLNGKKIGDEVDGALLGLAGYKLAITGGSDKGGFPMKKGVLGKGATRVLMREGVGYNPKKDERKRKRVHGEVVGENIIQINMKVAAAGKKSIEDLLGAGKESASEEKKEE